MNLILSIFIGGGLGSLARYGVSVLANKSGISSFPIGTFIANITSCIILGVLVNIFADKANSENLKGLLIIGFCGGFSTFSTFSFETFQLIKNEQWMWAIANILISVLAGLLILFYIIQKSKV